VKGSSKKGNRGRNQQLHSFQAVDGVSTAKNSRATEEGGEGSTQTIKGCLFKPNEIIVRKEEPAQLKAGRGGYLPLSTTRKKEENENVRS